MPFMICNKIKLYDELVGEGEPLVLINGLGSDIHLDIQRWEFLVKQLKGSFKVIMFDMRGAPVFFN